MKTINPYYEKLQLILKTLPDAPGIYQYYDDKETIIYIGKAKNLKKRVASYFNKETLSSGKLSVLVKKIANIEHIVVDNEWDALLLENNLIKKYQPRYNVLLKDDKTFPWICIKNELFPRIFSTRNLIKDGSQYFGPYASVRMMNTLLDLIKQLYQLRTCNFVLSKENIKNKKFKVCLEYHIKNCKGPCEGLQSEKEYSETIDEIKHIIKGNISMITHQLKELMNNYAQQLEFEKAHVVKQKIELLEKYQSKSTIVSPTITNVDVFSIVSDNEYGYVNFIKVVDGAIVQSHTLELKKKLDESDAELLLLAIIDIRQRFESNAQEIIIPFEIETQLLGASFTIPQKGDKKNLLDLSRRNANFYRLEKLKQKELIDPQRHAKRILSQMMKDLRMKETPAHIECFDNSNFQGDSAVAAMVVFKNAKPSKDDYRHFTIKSVEGPNDVASMQEVVYRRYKRLLDEKQSLPQLIVVDGGKPQLNAALRSLQSLGLKNKITVIGIAKRLEEIYYPEDPLPLYLDKKSETLKVIQHIRDEAHRFGITHHRNKRDKETLKTELTEISGIGQATADELLNKFKSVIQIKEATLDELKQVIGQVKGKRIFDYFNSKKNGQKDTI